jgi:hypothetical protein
MHPSRELTPRDLSFTSEQQDITQIHMTHLSHNLTIAITIITKTHTQQMPRYNLKLSFFTFFHYDITSTCVDIDTTPAASTATFQTQIHSHHIRRRENDRSKHPETIKEKGGLC